MPILLINIQMPVTDGVTATRKLTAKSRKDILAYLGIKNHWEKMYIAPLIDKSWLCLTIPPEPNHPKQKFITTLQGKKQPENATQ